jgi:hypothetical protein
MSTQNGDSVDPGRRNPGRLVRPYTLTGGRTRPSHADLELEALVSTTSRVNRPTCRSATSSSRSRCSAATC